MVRTLDQQRAAYAWDAASKGVGKMGKEYLNLAKGAPALIMSSGLMPTLAFFHSKGEAHEALCNDIAAWLNDRFSSRREYQPLPTNFASLMVKLHGSPSAFYLEATTEALEILKWIRQFVDAVPGQRDGHG